MRAASSAMLNKNHAAFNVDGRMADRPFKELYEAPASQSLMRRWYPSEGLRVDTAKRAAHFVSVASRPLVRDFGLSIRKETRPYSKAIVLFFDS
jgi:hypothetical protein